MSCTTRRKNNRTPSLPQGACAREAAVGASVRRGGDGAGMARKWRRGAGAERARGRRGAGAERAQAACRGFLGSVLARIHIFTQSSQFRVCRKARFGHHVALLPLPSVHRVRHRAHESRDKQPPRPFPPPIRQPGAPPRTRVPDRRPIPATATGNQPTGCAVTHTVPIPQTLRADTAARRRGQSHSVPSPPRSTQKAGPVAIHRPRHQEGFGKRISP